MMCMYPFGSGPYKQPSILSRFGGQEVDPENNPKDCTITGPRVLGICSDFPPPSFDYRALCFKTQSF